MSQERLRLIQQLESCRTMLAAHPQGSPAWEAAYSQGCRIAAVLDGRASPPRAATPAPEISGRPQPTVAVGGDGGRSRAEVDPRYFQRAATRDPRFAGRREEPAGVVDPRPRLRKQKRKQRRGSAPAAPRPTAPPAGAVAHRPAPAAAGGPVPKGRRMPVIRFSSPRQLASWLGAAAKLSVAGYQALRKAR